MQIIETSFCLLLSWAMYEILLRRETFFQLNRVYLLLMSVAAFVLPLLHFDVHHEVTSPVVLPFIIENNEIQSIIYQPFIQEIPLFSFTIGDVLQVAFFIGFFYKIIKLSVTLWKISQLMGVCTAKKQEGITFLTASVDVPTASFFSYIFWNEKNDKQQDFILQHELVHVRQWHTIDVLLMELLLALQWFNPLMYYFRNRLKEVHEFIADEFVVQQTGQRYQYAAILVEAALKPSTPSSVVNTFSSFTKQRLIMLAKNRSPFWKVTKYFLVLPLFCAFVLLFSFDLIAKISTPLPQMEAFLDNFQKQSISVQNDYNIQINNDLQAKNDVIKTIEITEKTKLEEDNFIFYWGSFQLKFQAANGNENVLSSSAKVTKSKLQDLVYHHDIPYFWNGKTLDDDFSFRLSYLDSTTMTLQSLDINRKEYLKTFHNSMNTPLLSLLKKLKDNDCLIVHELKTPSTGDKVLSGKILLLNDANKQNTNTFTIEQHQELGEFLDKKLNSRMDFKWGEIGIENKKVTKEILLNSILQQPILFNHNGQPIKALSLRLGHVPKIGGDALMMEIKSDLIDYDVYSSRLNLIHKAMSCVKPKDMVYFDNITGTDKNGNSLTFSIVLEISE